MIDVRTYFTDDEKARIKKAIERAELRTSGEVRVHVEAKCEEDVMDHSAFIFKELKMHKTELRNGILFYLSIENHKFSVLGDVGIHAKVGDEFWSGVRDAMHAHFKNEDICEGLCAGIAQAGKALSEHFPYQQDDVNELSDEISYGNG